MTAGKAAPIVGAILGTLFGLQTAFFLFSDLTGETALQTTLQDAFGLLAAVLILVGAFFGLRRRHAASS